MGLSGTVRTLVGAALVSVALQVALSSLTAAAASLLAPGRADVLLGLTVDGLERTALVHVPDGYDGHVPLPLVLVLHGAGGGAFNTARITGWDRKADEAGFLAIFPNGVLPEEVRAPDPVFNQRLWNAGSGRGYAGRWAVDDVRFIRALLDEVQARYVVDERRIYATGFSNGAAMTFRLGAELSARLAAIAPVAGPLQLDRPQPERPLATLYIVGAADPIYRFDDERGAVGRSPADRSPRDSVERWALALGCPPAPSVDRGGDGVTRHRYAPCAGGAELDWYVVPGQGHHWPGGEPELPRWLAGPADGQLAATAVIWEFFQQHPRPD